MGRKKKPKVHPLALARCRVLIDQITDDQRRQLAAIALQLQYLHAEGIFYLNGACSIQDEELADGTIDLLTYVVESIVESEGGEA